MVINAIILSSSAKVILLQSFQSALKSLGGKVYSSDIEQYCATAQFSDGHMILPRTNSVDFIDYLISECKKYSINLIIPSRDGELEILAQNLDKFTQNGIFVHCPKLETLTLAQNKRLFNGELKKIGLFGIPEFENYNQDNLPLFLRPIFGAGGKGIQKIESWDDMPKDIDNNIMVTPFIDKPEYSIDLLMSLDGTRGLCAVVRERNKILAGEARVTTTRDLKSISEKSIQIGEHLGLVGHNTVQAFYNEGEEPYFIEVNPRFGGASNCSIMAGLDSPNRIIKMLNNDDTAYAPFNIKYGLQMHRYSQDLFFNV